MLNVKAFGAKCDNSTDDSVAIIAAIRAANDANGGTVWIPQGGCVSSKAITMLAKVNLACAANASLRFTSATDGITYAHISNVSIRDCTLISSNPNSGKGLSFTLSGNILVDNVKITATTPLTNKWAYGHWLDGAQAMTFHGGQIQTAVVAIHTENAANANAWVGFDVTENIITDHYVESLGTTQVSTDNTWHGGIIEGNVNTALLLIRGGDSMKTYGVHFENAGASAPCVVADGTGGWSSFGDSFACPNPTISIAPTSLTRNVRISGGSGGTIMIGVKGHNTVIDNGYACSTTPCVVDNSAGGDTILGYTVNTQSFPWSQAPKYPTTMPPLFSAGVHIGDGNSFLGEQAPRQLLSPRVILFI
jgi:hypothetical protein